MSLTFPTGDLVRTAATMGIPLQAGAPQDVGLEAVAGRIDAPPSDLKRSVEAWLEHLGSLRRKPGSVGNYRQTVEAAIRECGWSRVDQVTFAAVTAWMAAKTWKGTTYNRNLSALRSWTKHLAASGLLARDPLADATRAADDGETQIRAGTVEDARALIAHAYGRELCDRRCTSSRAVYWAAMFLAGCRPEEPGRWQRRHLLLDEPVPLVRWSKDINKNGRLEEVPICQELAELLRWHMGRADAARQAEGLPCLPGDPVFLRVPTRATFRVDRAGAGIDELDSRGLRFAPRSGRKWFKTTLTRLGVHTDVVDRLMRHRPHVGGRYLDDADNSIAAAALAQLPRLWPVPVGGSGDGNDVDKAAGSRNPAGLSSEGLTGDARLSKVSAADLPAPTSSNRERRPKPGRSANQQGVWRSRLDDVVATGTSARASSGPGRLSSPNFLDPEMPISGRINGVNENDLADLLEALARVLRRGAGDVQPRGD